MARVEIRVSDLTGEQIPDEERAARLIVEHPDYPEPIGLDVLPNEITPHLHEDASRFVVVSLEDPENPTPPQRYALSVDEFNELFARTDAQEALEQAYSQQQEEQRSRRRGGKRASGKRQTESRQQRDRINYATPEHAGEPHRGVVSEAEAEIVRDNLDEVNDRLRRDGFREIDPNDPKMAADYGFPPPVGRDEVEERVEEDRPPEH